MNSFRYHSNLGASSQRFQELHVTGTLHQTARAPYRIMNSFTWGNGEAKCLALEIQTSFRAACHLSIFYPRGARCQIPTIDFPKEPRVNLSMTREIGMTTLSQSLSCDLVGIAWRRSNKFARESKAPAESR
jgi:hypothetical protein